MIFLQVCAYSAQYGGNFIASLTSLEKDLVAKGHQIEYVFPYAASKYQWCKTIQERAKVSFCSTNRFSLKTLRQIKMAMKNVDVIHSHFELYDILTALCVKSNQKLVWHLHDSFDENIDFFHRLINRFQYGVAGRKAILISPSKYYSDYTIQLGFNPDKVRLVDNCIDCLRLDRERVEKIQYDFLVFGGFYYIKGLDILLDACRQIKKENRKCKVGIVGYPDTWEWMDKYYSDVLDYIDRVEPSENVNSIYAKARCFLSTSRRESFSYALAEALYLEKKAIVSSIPGTQWCFKYDTVQVFISGDASDLAKKMIMIIDSKFTISEEKLQHVSEMIAKKYSIESWIPRIEGVYFENEG